MPITVEDLGNGLARVTLTGRIDLAGAHDIDMPMNVAAGSKRGIVVDLSGVDFMASLGLRTLVMTAKTVGRRGGRVVLLNPRPEVEEVIRTTGVDEVIPIMTDAQEALAAIGAA
jgi:anti-anti-sigma factor